MTNRPVPAESPVFVDRSGIRRRWFAVLGVAGGGVLALSVVVLIAGFLGTGPGRLPGLPVPPGQVARQAAAGPVASGPASDSPHPTPSGAAASRTAAARPSPTPAAPPTSPNPTPSPTMTRHGNAPPHPSHKK